MNSSLLNNIRITSYSYRREVGSTFNSFPFPLTNTLDRIERINADSGGGGTEFDSLRDLYGDQGVELQRQVQRGTPPETAIEDLFPKMDEPLMQILRWVFVAVYVVLFVIGFANILALFIVARFPRMQTVTNIFIFNLCLADFVYVLFLPFVIIFRIYRTWMFGDVICKLFYIAESTTKYASVYFVCVLSVDRYLALCYPTWCKRYRTLTLAVLASILGWTLTAALMTPIYLYSQVIEIRPTTQICGIKWPDTVIQNVSLNGTSPFTTEHYYTIYSFVFCFATPALLIIVFYFKVFEQLLQASDRAERLKKRKEQSYKRVTRMVLAVVTFYFICWTPYWIMYFVNTFAMTRVSTATMRIVFNIIHILPYLNCAVNPILYGLMTQTFKKILREMFPCLFCRLGRYQKPCCCCCCPSRLFNLFRAGSETPSRNKDLTTIIDEHNRNRQAIEDDEDSIRFVRSSISTSIQLMSTLCLNMLGKHELTVLVNGTNDRYITNGRSYSPPNRV